MKSPILAALGQPCPWEEVGALGGVLRRRAYPQPRPDRGVDADPFGQLDDGAARLGEHPFGGVGEPFAGAQQVELEARRRGGPAVAQLAGRHRFEAQAGAAFERRRGIGGRGFPGLLPGGRAGGEGERARAGGGHRQVGERAVADRRPDRAFGPGEGGLGLVQAIAALAVVGGRPGNAPEGQVELVDVERLGEVRRFPADAVGAGGVADARAQGNRLSVGGEADRGRHAGRRLQVEDAEAPHLTPALAAVDIDRADLGRVGTALARAGGFEGRGARGVEVRRGALRNRRGVFDQPRRQFDLQVAQVPVGEGDAGLGGFFDRPQGDLGAQRVGVGAGEHVGCAAFGAGEHFEPFGARAEAEVRLRGGSER